MAITWDRHGPLRLSDLTEPQLLRLTERKEVEDDDCGSPNHRDSQGSLRKVGRVIEGNDVVRRAEVLSCSLWWAWWFRSQLKFHPNMGLSFSGQRCYRNRRMGNLDSGQTTVPPPGALVTD